MMFNRKTYFDIVRQNPFGGSMSQQQVDGQEFLLSSWESNPREDLRHFAYMLATTFHETARTMQPIEEYGKGQGHPYGVVDAETGQTYYGRGYVQLTWRDNYARATDKLGLSGPNDLEWNASRALDQDIAYQVMDRGMLEGWFTGKKLPQYFDEDTNNPVGARQIINPDDKGKMVSEYHYSFLEALEQSLEEEDRDLIVVIKISAPEGVKVVVEDAL